MDKPFQVELKSSGQVLDIPADRSILEVVEEVITDIPWGCRRGECGVCAIEVLEGSVDHRDEVLSEAEQAASDCIMICVSRARDCEKLVLDI